MMTSAIGKIFLEAYNEEYGTNYDARTFFLEIFYPLFFDHNKYMMTAGNSPLENPKISWDDMIRGKKPFETQEQRNNRYAKLKEKMDGDMIDASIARGYYSADTCATTSGQVTDLELPLAKEDAYASWIGDALGVGVQGGFSILFTNRNILLDVFRGWELYRKCLNANAILKGNQINTWNGQWLAHLYDDKLYDEEHPLSGFDPYVSKDGLENLGTQSWTKVLIGIAQKYKSLQVIGNIYSIGQTNTSLGYIPFDLAGIRKPFQLYRKLFGLENRLAESLWGGAIGFKTCCAAGAIGIKAMEPKGLRDYITNKKKPKTPKNEEEKITINVYKIWILAMLNKDELWDKSQELAEMLETASMNKGKSASTKPQNLVDNVLAATNKKMFIAAATEVLPYIAEVAKFKEFVKEVHVMPNDNVPYFLTLLRFQFNTLQTTH